MALRNRLRYGAFLRVENSKRFVHLSKIVKLAETGIFILGIFSVSFLDMQFILSPIYTTSFFGTVLLIFGKQADDFRPGTLKFKRLHDEI